MDARGTVFTSVLLRELLEAVKNPETGRSHFGSADFTSAEFREAAWFGDVEFTESGGGAVRWVSSSSAMSRSIAAAKFVGAEFSGDVSFVGAQFGADTRFDNVRFDGNATFDGARFGKNATFDSARFTGNASFGSAEFEGDAGFDSAEFSGDAWFGDAEFGETSDFTRTVFRKRASFAGTIVGDGGRVGPCEATVLELNRVRVGKGVWVHCRVGEVDASDVHCPDGLNLQLDGGIYVDASQVYSAGLTLIYREGRLTVTDAAFESPTTIAAPTRAQGQAATTGVEPRPAPQLLSLQRVEATNLTLVGLDLRSCRFLECYNRDQLRIEGPPQFAQQPAGRRWTSRQVLADEHIWRACYDRHPAGWFPHECRHRGEDDPHPTPADRTGPDARHQAARIQTVYRDLRKGREDVKDEPGAADFYYGEMEMRRLAAPPHSVERALLTAYWAISGYGLRATRALAALLVLLALGAVGFATVGFTASSRVEYRPVDPTKAGQPAVYQQVTVPAARPGWRAAVDHSIDSATALVRTNQPKPLTLMGRAIEITVRLLGPLLLGLAVLAVRSRVKR